MARKSFKSFEDLKGQIDFTVVEKKEEKKEDMFAFGYQQEKASSALNKNKTKHRAKVYTLELDDYEDEEEEESFEDLFYEEESRANNVLKRNKARRKN